MGEAPTVEPGSGYYTTTAIAQHAIEMLAEHKAKHAGQPFLLYLAFNSPHFPLQALPEDIALYRPPLETLYMRVRGRDRLGRLGRGGIRGVWGAHQLEGQA